MLYVTTRNKHDAFTAKWSITQDRGADGGLFVPFHLPHLEREGILALKEQTFGQNVSDILNLLYSTKLTAWDVEVTIGRYPVHLRTAGLRILIGELFHNADSTFQRAVNALAARIHPDGELMGAPSNWMQIGIRIAVLFGVYGELLKNEKARYDKPLVLAVPSGSFAIPMAAWYARAMGLPVGTIVCGCSENGAPWELLHRGQLDTALLSAKNTTPETAAAVPVNLERLICGVFGQNEALRYWWTCAEEGTYVLPEGGMEQLQKDMFAAVVSRERVSATIASVYQTSRYILEPQSALAYSALSDYRSRTGSGAAALLWMENSPLRSAAMVAEAMHISVSELKQKLSGK